MENPTYLGDGAYVEWDGHAFVIYTSDGIQRTNEVYLEPDATQQLFAFVRTVTG